MLHGIGTDIVHIPRIVSMSKKYGTKFHKKFLHPQELEQYRSIKLDSHKNTFLASRWSTKEAAYKAFGKWRIPFYDMKVTYAEKGVPRLEFDGMAKEVAEQNNIGKAHVSISHDHEYAIAYVILEKLEK